MKKLIQFLVLFGVFGIGSVFVSCSGKQVDENDPAALFQEAEEDVSNDHYQIAIDKFRSIKNKFPYSKFSVDAQLRIADVYFLQESFAEAAIAYESFKDLHPKHEKVAYALFRIGKSYYNDIPSTVARDLSPAQKSLEAFNEFLNKFPNSPESEEARKAVVSIRSTLAEKELYIANFYYRQSEYEAARRRYSKILNLYPDTPSAVEAKERAQKMGAKSQ